MRNLTADETAALGDIVVNPAGWWANCQDKLEKPEDALAAKLAKWRSEYDARNAAGNYRTRAERDDDEAIQEATDKAARREARTYDLKRREAYGAIENQLDQIYHDQVDDTTVWKDHIAAVKSVHPKP